MENQMNIFEQYGGYEVVKQAVSNYKQSGDMVTAAGLELKCLEYRREHNIFEHGDYIVWLFDYEPAHLYQVKYITENGYSYGNDWGWYGVLSNEGVEYNFRHATDEEIKAGRRL